MKPHEAPLDRQRSPFARPRLATVIVRSALGRVCPGDEMAELSLYPAPGRFAFLFFLFHRCPQVFYPIVPLLTPAFSRVHSFTPESCCSATSHSFPNHHLQLINADSFSLRKLTNDLTTITYQLSNKHQHALLICYGAEHPRRRPGRCCAQPPRQLPRAS
jgi:hypothetical protein